jgi:hypothetical protein
VQHVHLKKKIMEEIYFTYFNTGLKDIGVWHFSVIEITLHYILRYRTTPYHSVAKLPFLNVITLGTREPFSRLKVISLFKYQEITSNAVTF